MAAIRDAYGLTNTAYLGLNLPGRLTSAGPHVLVTYSDAWVEHYRAQNFVEIDPVIHGSLRSILPTDWAHLRQGGGRVRELFNHARLFGVGAEGLSLPVRGPRGEIALFSVASNDSPAQWRLHTRERMAEYQILAHHVHNLIVREEVPAAPPRLAPREAEVLFWAAAGKTVTDTSVILGISAHTVRTYLEMARARLNALNTTHAVARSLALGLIRSPD